MIMYLIQPYVFCIYIFYNIENYHSQLNVIILIAMITFLSFMVAYRTLPQRSPTFEF